MSRNDHPIFVALGPSQADVESSVGGTVFSDDPAQALGTAASGSSSSASRSDHVHDLPTASQVGALASSLLTVDGDMVVRFGGMPSKLTSTAAGRALLTAASASDQLIALGGVPVSGLIAAIESAMTTPISINAVDWSVGTFGTGALSEITPMGTFLTTLPLGVIGGGAVGGNAVRTWVWGSEFELRIRFQFTGENIGNTLGRMLLNYPTGNYVYASVFTSGVVELHSVEGFGVGSTVLPTAGSLWIAFRVSAGYASLWAASSNASSAPAGDSDAWVFIGTTAFSAIRGSNGPDSIILQSTAEVHTVSVDTTITWSSLTYIDPL